MHAHAHTQIDFPDKRNQVHAHLQLVHAIFKKQPDYKKLVLGAPSHHVPYMRPLQFSKPLKDGSTVHSETD